MGVLAVPCPEMTKKAMAFADGYLLLGQLEGSREAVTVLTHEKWHYKLGAFYRMDTPCAEQARLEARVSRKAIGELVPKAQLTRLLRQGLRVYEIAELLEVPEATIWEAWRYYKDTDEHLWENPEET